MLAFDARPGAVAAIDNLRWITADGSDWLVDFEPNKYTLGDDVVGVDGWKPTAYCSAPATSKIVDALEDRHLRTARTRYESLYRKNYPQEVRRRALVATMHACQGELESVQAKLNAERTRYIEQQPLASEAITQVIAKEKRALILKAEAEIANGELALHLAESLPADDAKRAPNIAAANKAIAAAKDALSIATANSDRTISYAPLSLQYPQQSTGRRRALAEWITSSQNPLTARVAVNHIWTRHFHSPIVSTMVDFGRNGARPTNQPLLDFLASEWMRAGWDMKWLHRLMVTSETYRRVSHVGDATGNLAIDPENKLLWRMNWSRMESEVVRDSLLYVAGRLDTTFGGTEKEGAEALTSTRRSLYYSVYPEAGGHGPLGDLFDGPDPLDCYRRVTSIVPQQALVLTNSQLVEDSCLAVWNQFAQQTMDAGIKDDVDGFVASIFEQILGRSPTPLELDACKDIMHEQAKLAGVCNSRRSKQPGGV